MRLRGSILIAAVWVLVFFALMGTAFYNLFSGRSKLAAYVKNRPLAEQAAYSAVELVKFQTATDTDFADSRKEFDEELSAELGLASFVCRVIDEQSKLNINYGEPAMLARLPGMDMEKAAAVSASRLKPFESIEELRLVEGIDDSVFSQIQQFITVYGEHVVNINTAPPAVLVALGMEEGLVEKVLRARAGNDQTASTEDDHLFADRTAIQADIEEAAVLNLREKALLTNLVGMGIIGVSSSACTLEIQTKVQGRRVADYRIVLDQQGICRWQES